MRKIYLNIIIILSIVIILFVVLDTSISKKNPKIHFTIQTNKKVYNPLDPIYFNAVIKNISGEYQNIKKEDYTLWLYMLNEGNEKLTNPTFASYGLMYDDEILLAPGDSLNFLKVIRFHNYIDPFYTGKYKLIIKYGQNDSIIKEISFQEPKNPIEKEIYYEYKELYKQMFYEGKYSELKDDFKKLYYKIKSEYSESDYLSYISFHYLMDLYSDRDFEKFKNEFLFVLDKKHSSYSVESFLNSYFNYFIYTKGMNRNTILDFYHSLVYKYSDNTALIEVMKLSYTQIFNIYQITIE
jgi:hypothetical protein